MKRFSKAIVIMLLTLSLALLASCGKEDKDDNNNNGNNGGQSGGIINPDGGVSGPIIPWD